MLVAGLFFEAGKKKSKFHDKRNFHESQVQFTSASFVPLEWIHESPTVIFSQPIFLRNVGHDSSHMCVAVCCSVLQCVAVCCSVCYTLHSPFLRRPQTGLHLHNPHANGVLSSLHFMFVKPFSEHQYLLHTCGRRVILSRMVVAACGSIGEITIAQGLLCFHLGCTCTENTVPRRCPRLVSTSSGGQ